MYIPSKITKGKVLQNDRVFDHQNTVSKYYKQYLKLKKGNEELDRSKQKQHATILREEVISWFFSLDLLTRLIISSIENKWVTCFMHQLYIEEKLEPNHKFQIKEGLLSVQNQTGSYGSDYCQQILKLSMCGNIYNSGINQDTNLITDEIFNYLGYFSQDENIEKLNNYKKQSKIDTSNKNLCNTQELFLKEIKFYKSDDFNLGLNSSKNIEKYSNYFTLSEKLLKDENLFNYYFDKLSNGNSFTHLIPVSFQQSSKHHNLYLPDWIKPNEFYSVAEFFAAFFEQVITVKYILYKQSKNMPKVKSHLQSIVSEAEELFNFIRKIDNIGSSLFKLVKEKNIIADLFKDETIQDFVINKFSQCKNSTFFNSSKLHLNVDCDIIFDKEKMSPLEIEKKLQQFLLKFDDEIDQSNKDKLLKEFIYLSLDKIFTYDDFLFRKIYECLLQYKQKESYEYLINDSKIEENYAKKLNKRKKKKNRKQDDKVEAEKELKISNLKNNDETQLITHHNQAEKKCSFSFIHKKKSSKTQNIDERENIDTIVKEILEVILSNLACNYLQDNENNNGKNENIVNNSTGSLDIPTKTEIDPNGIKLENNISNDCNLNINKDRNISVLMIEAISTNNQQKNEEDILKEKNLQIELEINENLIEGNKNIFSPRLSEKNENNDTDTAYSSEDKLSGSKKRNDKKSKNTNKVILYDDNFNKKTINKTPNSDSNCDSFNTQMNNSIHKTENLNSFGGSKLSKMNEKKSIISLSNNVGSISPKSENFFSIKSSSDIKINLTSTKKVIKKYKQNDDYNGIISDSNRKHMNQNTKYNEEKNSEMNSYNDSINNQKRKGINNYSKFPKFHNRNVYETNTGNKYANIFVRSQIGETTSYNQNLYPFPFFNNYPFNTISSCHISNGASDFYVHHNALTFEHFQLKLHKDILNYQEASEKMLLKIRPFKILVIKYLEKHIKDFFSIADYNLNAAIEVYGSFASELDIECSDIDMTISLEDNLNSNNKKRVEYEYISIMAKLTEYLAKLKVFKNVNPIYTASVPVIKLEIDVGSILDDENKEKLMEFKNSASYQNYRFNKEELDKIKLDLTFLDLIKLRNKNNNIPQNHVNYVKASCLIYPEIKPMVKIFKRLLQLNNLNNTFNGGLSSFSIFLLILAYVKIHRFKINNSIINLGKLLTEFIVYNGSFVNFNFTIIDVNMENPFVLYPQPLEIVPCIVDPISLVNAGKSSYKFSEVIKLFNYSCDNLNNIKIMMENSQIESKENIVNLIFRIIK